MRKSGWSGLLVLLLLCGCANGAPWVKIGGERYAVEIADDDAERARGLMFRDLLAEGHGMLFIHERARIVEIQDIQRDTRVFHPEAQLPLVGEHENHAMIWRH